MGALPTGAVSLSQVRANVQKSGTFNIRDRRAIWIAFQKDSKTYTGSISMDDFKGKDYDASWVWYGNETQHHSREDWNSAPPFTENQILSSPYVEADWQYRWVVNRVAASSWSVQTSGHGRNRHGRYSRSRRYRTKYRFVTYKKLQRRAW